MNDELWIKYRNHLLNEGLSDSRITKLRYVYGTLRRYLGGTYEGVGRERVEEFLNDLNNNRIQSNKKKAYAGNTKADFKKFLKQFYKWYEGEGEYFPKNVSWIKARVRKDEQPIQKKVLTIDECLRLSASFRRAEYRALLLLLFDSGFRISEMLSVNKRDLTFEEFEQGKKCFWIKCNKSKTIPRKVPINLFSDELREFTNSAHFKGLGDDEVLFPINPATIRKRLRIRSMSVLGRKVTPHLFRHSSATYYAKLLNGNLFALCERYGWSFSSDEAKTYIRGSGQYQIEGAKSVYQDELQLLKEKLRGQEERMQKVQEALMLLEQLKEKGVILK